MFGFFKKLLPNTPTQFAISTLGSLTAFGILQLDGIMFDAHQNYIRQLQLLTDDEFQQLQSQALFPYIRNYLRNDVSVPIPLEYIINPINVISIIIFFALNLRMNNDMRQQHVETQPVRIQRQFNVPTTNQDLYDQHHHNKEIPEQYICPITRLIINQPYQVGNHYYEAYALYNWYSSNDVNYDPLTTALLSQEEIDQIKDNIEQDKFDDEFKQIISNWMNECEQLAQASI